MLKQDTIIIAIIDIINDDIETLSIRINPMKEPIKHHNKKLAHEQTVNDPKLL